MTREIKFRGIWNNGETKKWVYGGIEIRHDGEILIGGNGVWYVVDPKTVGQYTGLKDKNATEIYEGGIVKSNWEKNKSRDVYFDKGRFFVRGFYVACFDDPSDAFGEGLSSLEIVGNIYESPELLKV